MPQDTSSQQAWIETIPKVPSGNTFASENHFFCGAGAIWPIRDEEEFGRARQIVTTYPENFRILRYEDEGYKPCLFGVYYDIDIHNYLTQGEGEIPISQTMQSAASKDREVR